MYVDTTYLISVGSVLVAIASLASNAIGRSSKEHSNIHDSIRVDLGKQIATTRSNFELRITQALSRCAENSAAIGSLELKMLRDLSQYPTKADFDRTLERVLEPIMTHISRNEDFMNDVLRSGMLNNTNNRRVTP